MEEGAKHPLPSILQVVQMLRESQLLAELKLFQSRFLHARFGGEGVLLGIRIRAYSSSFFPGKENVCVGGGAVL